MHAAILVTPSKCQLILSFITHKLLPSRTKLTAMAFVGKGGELLLSGFEIIGSGSEFIVSYHETDFTMTIL